AAKLRGATEHGLGRRSECAQLTHAAVAGGLAELAPVGMQHEWMVQEVRRSVVAEQAMQEDLATAALEQILAADHEVHALVEVVDAHAELIGIVAVAVAGENVAALSARFLHLASLAQVLEE